MPNVRTKYGAVKAGGYASKAEARRAAELKLLERAGKIENLGEQVIYEVIPEQRDTSGKLLERASHYIADFVYRDTETGLEVAEDVKGMKTREYILKRKLMLLRWGVRVREVA
jgi:hypothetical protein